MPDAPSPDPSPESPRPANPLADAARAYAAAWHACDYDALAALWFRAATDPALCGALVAVSDVLAGVGEAAGDN